MEKILLVVNNQQVSNSALEFACYIARLTNSKLTGIFINKEMFDLAPPQVLTRVYTDGYPSVAFAEQRESASVIQGMGHFLKTCARKGVRGEVYQREDASLFPKTPVDEVVYNSRYADLLIIDPETSDAGVREELPTEFVKQLLAQAECPVLLAPAVFEGIDEVVFCYDGGRSSVFAMKQFTYLFPQLWDKKVTVFEVNKNHRSVFEKEKIRGWLCNYYSQIGFNLLEGEVNEELLKHFFLKRNRLVVMGAYGRSSLSYLFKKSSAEVLIQMADLPLFIAHH